MLVEINLLPQREPKKLGLIIIVSSLLVLLLIIWGFYYFQIHSVKTEMASLDRQISVRKNLVAKEQSNAQEVESASSVNQLKAAIDWADNYPIQTVPVMHYLSSLLPARGFVQSFSYTDDGAVSLSVQFDSSREAAFFLDSLNQSKWIDQASLSSLTTTTIESNTAGNAAVPNSQTNNYNATNNQNTTANSTNSANQMNGTTLAQSDQTRTTVNQTAHNGSANPTSKSSNNASVTKATDNNYLPRYIGSFSIKFNTDYVKKVLKTSKQDEKGVTGS